MREAVKRVIVVMRGVVSTHHDKTTLVSTRAFEKLVHAGQVSVIEPEPEVSNPDLSLLGVRPDAFSIPEGVLTSSSFKVDPPERTVHFHLSLCSMSQDTGFGHSPPPPSQAEELELQTVLERLATSVFVPNWGSGLDHMLFWLDGSIDVGTTPPGHVKTDGLSSHLPEGDGEHLLRRFIDDSVNLLQETEANKRRAGEGVPELNVFWPWGQGLTPRLPNLALRRGETVRFESRERRLAGLVRLFGYEHGALSDFGRPFVPDWKRLLNVVENRAASVLVFGHIGEALARQRFDDAGQMLQELDDEFVSRIALQRPIRLSLFALPDDPKTSPSLSAVYDSEIHHTVALPFDERVFDDRRARRLALSEAMVGALRP